MITTVPHQRPTQIRFTDTDGDELLVDIEGDWGVVFTTVDDARRYVPVQLDGADRLALITHLAQPTEVIDVRDETGIETYANDEPGDPNPGIMIDTTENRGRVMTPAQARALAVELLGRAAYLESLEDPR